ncbi:hypothetical protein D5R81_19940 [Parashewanella spongiae]|uniref:Uncharacterized protein n=1 Tax=Parashewanella spongiae TaxID=342950 RepID=A0A3A6T4J9_9GAMM|nr:hypothetical protein [Parashewanella spongiae]MCL1080305.1 hypothetical protein [Parashewanella spongiae]RJY01560.1 hypothetical protein D5R81_19940 [Parashewanella spongiae]
MFEYNPVSQLVSVSQAAFEHDSSLTTNKTVQNCENVLYIPGVGLSNEDYQEILLEQSWNLLNKKEPFQVVFKHDEELSRFHQYTTMLTSSSEPEHCAQLTEYDLTKSKECEAAAGLLEKHAASKTVSHNSQDSGLDVKTGNIWVHGEGQVACGELVSGKTTFTMNDIFYDFFINMHLNKDREGFFVKNFYFDGSHTADRKATGSFDAQELKNSRKEPAYCTGWVNWLVEGDKRSFVQHVRDEFYDHTAFRPEYKEITFHGFHGAKVHLTPKNFQQFHQRTLKTEIAAEKQAKQESEDTPIFASYEQAHTQEKVTRNWYIWQGLLPIPSLGLKIVCEFTAA